MRAVVITEHGRPIAHILPLSASSPAAAAQELVRGGQIKAPEKRLDETFWQLPRAEYRVPPRRRSLDDLEDPGEAGQPRGEDDPAESAATRDLCSHRRSPD